jgi:hypothetical protein
MIESIGRNGHRQLVNGKGVKLWGIHTWLVLDNDEELEEWQDFLTSIDVTMDRLWVGWNKAWTGAGRPTYAKKQFRRANRHCQWARQKGVVVQLSLLQGSGIEQAKLLTAHKHHIDAVLSEIGNSSNVIMEVGNEISRPSFSADGVKYLRQQGWKGLIAVNTGRSGPTKALEDVGADIIAVTPGYVPHRMKIMQADSDHGPKGALMGDKRPWFQSCLDDLNCSHYLIMAAWDDPDTPEVDSTLSGHNKPWNDPNNKSIGPAIKWCQNHIGNQIVATVPPPPPPPGPGPGGGGKPDNPGCLASLINKLF